MSNLAWIVVCLAGLGADAEMPQVIDERLTLELFAAEPDIVTPIGMTTDEQGRPLVIESHTHFRPEGYDGPTTDRIRRLEDTDADGRADRFTTFWEGSTHTMGIGRHLNGWVYVATRNDVFRLRDSDDDGVADVKEQLVTLVSDDDYPHAGISGFAFDTDGRVFFGVGENHAKPFVMTSIEGTKQSSIEGGHVYTIDPDGRNFERVAIGCWNPFAMTFDLAGRLLAVDNDPDSLPPCRLLHVVPGGDYGYKYRNGRRGTHPFTAWNGELPGTLPMVAGTGEAPSGIWACGTGDSLPSDYRGDLLVTSWGDHRLERYVLKPRGASVSAERIDVVKGGENFRPVGITADKNGSLYISDWVDKSYTLHKQGRIWRLRTKEDADKVATAGEKCPLSEAELRAASLRTADDPARADELWTASEDRDPFLAQAAREGLKRLGIVTPSIDLAPLNAPRRLSALLILRDQATPEAESRLPDFLRDADPLIRMAALRWAGEEKVSSARDSLEATLTAGPATAQLFAMYLAAVERLDRPARDERDEWTNEQYVIEALLDEKMPAEVRRWALRTLRPDHPELTVERFRGWLADREMQLEAVRSLRERPEPECKSILWPLAGEPTADARLRAEAIVGLRPASPEETKLLTMLSESADRAVRAESLRSLREALPADESRPPITDIDAWMQLLEGPADAEAGERIFFHEKVAGCNRCHTIDGRGARVGPELSTAARALDRRRLVESILQPSKEIAPQFIGWSITTVDGRVLTGMLVGETREGVQTYVGPDAKPFTLTKDEIDTREELRTSIMPEGLVKQMTTQEFRDLLVYLQGRSPTLSAPISAGK